MFKGSFLPVRAVRSCHDDNVGAGLKTIHKSQKLRDDAALDLAVDFVALGSNAVNLIDEDD